MAAETDGRESARLPTVASALGVLVAGLAGLLALSLLVVGTVAVIAEMKGTWHWAIHLESTISHVRPFVGWLLVVLVPAFLALVVSRWVVGDD